MPSGWWTPRSPRRTRSTSRSTSTSSTSSIAPGHSLPEPGGLSYRELRDVLAAVAGRGRVIGFDLVELNPARDPAAVTARVASWTAVHFLSAIFAAGD